MNKEVFLRQLKKGLRKLPVEERRKQLSYYSELIDDMVEDGMSEAEAVARLGGTEEICTGIMAEMEAQGVGGKGSRASSGSKALLISLIILGSPIWLSILVAIFAVVLSLYICFWAIVISLFAVALALAASALVLLVMMILKLVAVNPAAGLLALACAFILAGLAVLFGLGAYWTAKGAVLTAGAIINAVKGIFAGKER